MNDRTDAELRDEAYGGRAIVAAFPDRESGVDAVQRLDDEGFRDVWLGVTRSASTVADDVSRDEAVLAKGTQVEAATPSFGERIARFFGEGGTRSLYDELVRHGVASSEATRIDRSLEPNSAILTVDGHNHPEFAVEIIEECGGHVLAGEHFAGTAGTTTSARATSTTAAAAATTAAATAADDASPRGSRALGYGPAREYARGEQIDEQRRLQLRAERLAVQKQQEAVGEAVVGKEIVEHREERSIPVVREELFIERRELGAGAAADAASGDVARGDVAGGAVELGREEAIRIPLMREKVVVTKRPVVTGEVVVGKRRVTGTERVDETVREERLRVDDPGARATKPRGEGGI